MQRLFADMLLDVIGSVGSLDRGLSLRVSTLELNLPLEVSLVHTAAESEFVADVPRWRWTTVFDKPCSRLYLVCDFGADR